MTTSEFDKNTATTSGDGGGGGVLYSEERTITIITFDSNSAAINGVVAEVEY